MRAFIGRGLGLAAMFAAFVLAGPALAQVKGIAIAAAPEGAYFSGTGERPEAALNAARAACRQAGETTCFRVRWCYPAGHSGAMSYLANRELTQVTFLCGAPSADALVKMLAAQCAAMPGASECRLITTWGPEGNETSSRTLLGKNTAD